MTSKSSGKAKAPAKKKTASKKTVEKPANNAEKPVKMTAFLKSQQQRLLDLRDSLMDAMAGVAKDNLRSSDNHNEASAFGMHQADAGSDSYDRDFALHLLSQEQNALYEIEEALKRIELGEYGMCEMSGDKIPKERLQAIPFARFTVQCQSEIEKNQKIQNVRRSVSSLFGLTDDNSSS